MTKHKCKWGIDYYGKDEQARLVRKAAHIRTNNIGLDWHGDAMECGESIETAQRERNVNDYLAADKPGYYTD